MALKVGEIYTEAVIKDGKLKKGLTAAEKKTRASAKKMQSSLNKINFKKLAIGVAAFGVAAGLAFKRVMRVIGSVAELGDKFNKMSLRTGIAVETLSAFDHVAKISGTDIDVFEKSVRYLSKTMLDMSRGIGLAKRTFEELGLSVTDSDGKLKDTTTVLLEVADKIKNMKNETKMAAFASEIFGAKAGTQLLPMLKLGSAGIEELMGKAKDLNLIFSTEGAQAAADYTDAMTELTSSVEGLKRELSLELLPALTSIAQTFTSLIQKKNELKDFWVVALGIDAIKLATKQYREMFNILFPGGGLGEKGFVGGMGGKPSLPGYIPGRPGVPSIPATFAESLLLPPGMPSIEELPILFEEATMAADDFYALMGPDYWKNINTGINDASSAYGILGNAMTSVLTNALLSHRAFFDSVLSGFKQMLNRMIAELAAKAAIFAFLNFVTQGSFGTAQKAKGGFWGFLGFQSGGYTGAMGGVVHPREYVIPEPMVRNMPGMVAGLENIRKGGGTQSFSVTNNFSSNVNNESRNFFRTQMIPQLNDAMRTGLLKIQKSSIVG